MIEKIILPVNQENGMDDNFTSNIYRSFLEVIHGRAKTTKIPTYYLDEQLNIEYLVI